MPGRHRQQRRMIAVDDGQATWRASSVMMQKRVILAVPAVVLIATSGSARVWSSGDASYGDIPVAAHGRCPWRSHGRAANEGNDESQALPRSWPGPSRRCKTVGFGCAPSNTTIEHPRQPAARRPFGDACSCQSDIGDDHACESRVGDGDHRFIKASGAIMSLRHEEGAALVNAWIVRNEVSQHRI